MWIKVLSNFYDTFTNNPREGLQFCVGHIQLKLVIHVHIVINCHLIHLFIIKFLTQKNMTYMQIMLITD